MKLYTEEQVTELTTAAFTAGQNHNPAIFGVAFEKITPIELPSDEDINKRKGFEYPANQQDAFEEGAKWMRNKIQGGNK